MKSCPKCSSTRISRSHAQTLTESIFRYGLGYHYYRCKACGWRGKGIPHKSKNISSRDGRPGLWKQLTIYALGILIGLIVALIYINKQS